MVDMRQIRARLLSKEWVFGAKSRLKQIVKASESPKGFGMIVGAGLAFLLVWHLIPGKDIALDRDDIPGTEVQNEETALIEDADTAQAEAPLLDASMAPEVTLQVRQYKLRRGETLIGLLQRAHVQTGTAHQLVASLRRISNLRRLQQGQEIRLTGSPDGQVTTLRMRDEFDSEAVVYALDSGFEAKRETIATLPLTRLVEGEITDSLYLSAQRAGLPTKVIVELIRLMSFDVDFEREIRTGDRFQVYFERQYAPHYDDTQDGQLLQAKLWLQKRDLEANYFIDSAGDADYFDDKGNSTRKALMKTPLDVTVVTSSYGKRKHPVLGYTRMHKGVDFRARTGTPIMAAGDGVVERASRYGAYGNYIRLRHNSTYKTAYAHLSRYGKGIKAGARVKQGQIIGYAGATGRVNAAHLHYEVMMNDTQVNPLTLDLPTGRSLTGDNLIAFQGMRNLVLADIAQIQKQYAVAMMDDRLSDQRELASDTANPDARLSEADR